MTAVRKDETALSKDNTTPNYRLHIFTLCSFVVAQPLLDLISRNVELLVARQTSTFELVILLLALTVVVPTLFILPGQAVRLISMRLGNQIFMVTIGFLASLLSLLVFKKIIPDSAPILFLLAALVGVAFNLVYSKHQLVRMICTYSSPAIVLFPLLFIFNPDVSRVVLQSDDYTLSLATEVTASSGESISNIPVVMVIFDELPIISLLDEAANIDKIRYPNFAALATDSHWFRNAQSVSGLTTVAVPAILSGIKREQAIPIVADYPRNLFTVLAPSHEMHVTEIVTSLCPESVCERQGEGQTLAPRRNSEGLLSDLSIVYLHILLPTDLTTNLPVVTQSWGDFSSNEFVVNDVDEFVINWDAMEQSRYGKFSRFIDSINSENKISSLYFYHALLPHMPWEYLPSGKLYSMTGNSIPGLDVTADKWGANETLVNQAYQRHLLQLGFVDSLLGELIEKLTAEGLYEESLLVIASDHGAVFWPESIRRGETDSARERDIFGISLFMKLPHQQIGVLHDEPVSTLDIVPTIASILELSQSLPMEPINIVDREMASNGQSRQLANPYLDNISLLRKIELFGFGDIAGLFKHGSFPQLIDHNQNDFTIQNADNLSYELDQQGYLEDVNLNAPYIPARLTGKINGRQGNIDIAISLNKKIVALSRSWVEGDRTLFSVMLPEMDFVSGKNTVELFVIQALNEQEVALQRIGNSRSSNYHYVSSNNNDDLISDQSDTLITLNSSRVMGFVDTIKVENDIVRINGWAADREDLKPADFILLDINGELTLLGGLNFTRPDVAQSFGSSDLQVSGYNFRIPLSRFGEHNPFGMRIIAVSGQQASVLESNAAVPADDDNPVDISEYNSNSYELIPANEGEYEFITDNSDKKISFTGNNFAGFIDSVSAQDDFIQIDGWAADMEQSQPIEFLLLDIDGVLLYLGAPGVERQDVARVYDNPGLLNSGYTFRVVKSKFPDHNSARIRVIGVRGGEAIILKSSFNAGEKIMELIFP